MHDVNTTGVLLCCVHKVEVDVYSSQEEEHMRKHPYFFSFVLCWIKCYYAVVITRETWWKKCKACPLPSPALCSFSYEELVWHFIAWGRETYITSAVNGLASKTNTLLGDLRQKILWATILLTKRYWYSDVLSIYTSDYLSYHLFSFPIVRLTIHAEL